MIPAAAPRDIPPPAVAFHRRPWVRTLAKVLGGILLTLFALWAILYVTKGRFLKGTFERVTTSWAERDVRVAGDFQLYFDPFDLKFLAEGLSIANPKWRPGKFIQAELVDTRTRTLSMIWGPREVNWLTLRGARIDLAWDDARRRNSWTFGDPDAPGEPFELPIIRAARIDGTRLSYSDPSMRLSGRVMLATVDAQDSRFANAVRFTGDGQVRDTDFTLDGALLTPNASLAGGRTTLALNARAVGSKAAITGTLPAPTVLEGADLRLDLRGENLARVFDIAGVVVPDTRDYRLRSAVTKAGDEWRFTGMTGTFGDSDIRGWFTAKMQEPRLLLTADLRTRTLDIVDVAPFIGYNPDLIAARGADGAITRVGGAPRIMPDARLRVEALKNFDADVRYRVQRLRAESLPISDIDVTLGLDDRMLTLSPATATMSRGKLTGTVAINARRDPAFTTYDIRLTPTPLGTLLAGWGVEQSGTTGTVTARVQLTGTGNSVHDSLATADGRIAFILPAGTMWARNIQLSEIDIGTFVQKMFEDKLKEPVRINCGLVAFTVRNGVGAADPILIDTTKNVMIGRGGFSFRNESIDLAFRADSKKISLFAGQSPVAFTGYFAEPKMNAISPELLGRAGVGLGLALVATPVAGVLAFVDVGDAKSTACGPVLAGADASDQRTTKGERRDDVGRGTTAKNEDGSQSRDQKKAQRKKFLGIF